MIAKILLPALVAATAVSAQSSTCTKATLTVNSAADATALSSCRTLKGNVVIGPDTGDTIDLSGPGQIDGDLTMTSNGRIVSLSSTSLNSISGTFKLQNITILSTLSFPALQSVGAISFQSLPALDELSFGTPGITEAKSVIISDTHLNSLDGIDLETTSLVDINNNGRLTEFNTQLGNLSDNLNIQANGKDLKVTMPNLIWIANMTIANVTEFSVPSLEHVNGSMRFDSNYFESFTAPNLTSTGQDISFVSNSELTNISIPILESVGGGLTIANNTGLEKINLPKLETVGGAVKFRGNFSSVSLPKINDVKGAFDIASTTNITASCDTFEALNGVIQGSYSCEGEKANANDDTSDGDSGSSGSSGSGSDDNDNAGASVAVNSVILGAIFIGAVAQLL